MENTQKTLKWNFANKMQRISAYWAMLIADSERVPVDASVAKILAENAEYVSERIDSRRNRNSKNRS